MKQALLGSDATEILLQVVSDVNHNTQVTHAHACKYTHLVGVAIPVFIRKVETICKAV